MAYLRQDIRTGKWFVCFRSHGTQHNKGCETIDRSKADIICTRVKDNIQLFRSGRIALPDEVESGEWIDSSGKTISNRSKGHKLEF